MTQSSPTSSEHDAADPAQAGTTPLRLDWTCIVLMATLVLLTIVQVRWGMTPNYGFDEAWHGAIAYIKPLWVSLLTASADTHPFLYYILLRPLYYLGSHPFVPRLLSIIPTIVTVPLLFLLLRRLRMPNAIALTTVVVMAMSFGFNEMGVMVRSYALTAFALIGALWFWLNMLPGGPSRPSRFSAIASLALFTFAFWCLYASAFVTAAIIGATLLIMLFNSDFRRQTWANWRGFSSWPEWILFFGLHGLGVAWFLLGRHNEQALGLAPGHVVRWLAKDGQNPVDYLLTGLRQEVELFTPLMGMPELLVNIGLGALLVLIVLLTVAYLRRGQALFAVVALTPLLLTAILALAGLFRLFPFGGELRHQYVLFPFLLLLLPLTLNLIWPRGDSRWLKAGIIGLVVAIAVVTTLRTHRANFWIGEPAPKPWWGEETAILFKESSDIPVMLPRYTFYTTLTNLLRPGARYQTSWNCNAQQCVTAPQGFGAIFEDWPDFQQHRVWRNGGGTTELLKSRNWLFGVLPDDRFFKRTHALVDALGVSGIRILSPAGAEVATDEAALSKAAARNGFKLSWFHRTDNALLWQIDIATPVEAPEPPPAAAVGDQGAPPKSE